MKRWLLFFLTASLMGCEQQIRLGAEQTMSTVPTILEDNMAANLYRVYDDRFAVIAQGTLKESVSNAQNTYNYGVNPNIAFRAIAVTGLTATAANSLSENWVVDPVVKSIDQRRLQILYRYAIRPDHDRDANFANLFEAIVNTGVPVKKPSDKDDAREKLASLMNTYLPKLPHGPFAFRDGAACNEPIDYDVKLALSLKHICFRGDQPTESNAQVLTGREKASLLVLWSLAIPELSATGGGDASSNSKLSISSSPVPLK